MSESAGVRIGVDIGGTFTDIVLARADGTLHVAKVSSTPRDPGEAVVRGLRDLLADTGIDPREVIEIVHGTTVGSNTILQKAGARTGLLTTRGFRDVLEIGRIRTPEMFDLTWDKPVPLIERRDRLEVDERIAADGTVVRPLDPASVEAAVDRLVADGVASIAICLINSYVNAAHEQAIERLIEARHPRLRLSASYRVLPEMKEYERTSTTVVNAYILPVMQAYLANLSDGLRGIGIEAPLLVVASNGGVVSAAAAAEKPVFAVGSGPAAGVSGAGRLGVKSGSPDLIAFDMGGTTAKASLVEAGQPTLTTEYEFREGISTPSRFIKAGGYMLKVPAIDIAEVGAGAGSIASINSGGLLQVGPESAGADPGPACYGLGGERPTVADANVVLGYLNPHALAGGSMPVDRGRAEQAIVRYVAEPLGLDLTAAAHGIRAVANANMARAVRSVTVERGRDPREFALMCFGGAGALHAIDIARTLEIGRILVPELPGVFTAVGMLASDVEHHFVRAHAAALTGLDLDAANHALANVLQQAMAVLFDEGYDDDPSNVRLLADLRYAKQSSEISVPLPAPHFTSATIEQLTSDFVAAYRRAYGYASSETPELVNLRAVAVGRRPTRLEFGGLRVTAPPAPGVGGRRAVSFSRDAPAVETPVLDRSDIADRPRPGPAIIETYESTIPVPPGARVRRDDIGNIVIELD